MSSKDYYKILGLEKSVSTEEHKNNLQTVKVASGAEDNSVFSCPYCNKSINPGTYFVAARLPVYRKKTMKYSLVHPICFASHHTRTRFVLNNAGSFAGVLLEIFFLFIFVYYITNLVFSDLSYIQQNREALLTALFLSAFLFVWIKSISSFFYKIFYFHKLGFIDIKQMITKKPLVYFFSSCIFSSLVAFKIGDRVTQLFFICFVNIFLLLLFSHVVKFPFLYFDKKNKT